MLGLGLSTCGSLPTEETFKGYRDAGIEYMEISPDHSHYESMDYAKIKKLSERYGVSLWSWHLPFYPFSILDISSESQDIRQNTVAFFEEIIKNASAIGVDKFVIHPSGEPIESNRRQRLENAKQSLNTLTEIASSYGCVIAVEDLPRTCLGNCSDEIAELISVNDKLAVCFDTNHLLTQNNDEFADRLGDKIITLHVSDYDFTNEKHWLPTEGKVDWQSLIRVLIGKGYNGVWMYEVGLTTPKTINRSRDLVYTDFAKNAKALGII